MQWSLVFKPTLFQFVLSQNDQNDLAMVAWAQEMVACSWVRQEIQTPMTPLLDSRLPLVRIARSKVIVWGVVGEGVGLLILVHLVAPIQ